MSPQPTYDDRELEADLDHACGKRRPSERSKIVNTLSPSKTETSAVPVASPVKRSAHLAYLDGFRGLAALYVLLGHAFATVLPVSSGGHMNVWMARIAEPFKYGHFAVDLFIVLSGFCLMLPVVRSGGELRGGVLGFLKRRARRILPPYYFALLLSLALVATLIGKKTGTHWDVAIPVTKSGLLAHLLLIQDFSGHWYSQVNHVMWSIAVEWQIYFLFPLLLLGWRRIGAAATVFLALIAGYALVRATTGTDLVGITAQYIGLFAMGMLGASISFDQTRWQTIRRRIPWGPITLVAAIAVLAVCRKFPGLVDRDTAYVDLLVGLFSTLLLILSSVQPECAASRFAALRPVAFLGTFGYSIYLIHAPLLQVAWQYGLRPLHMGPAPTLFALIFLATPIILAIAYIFFLFCERPFMNTRPAGARSNAPVVTLRSGEEAAS